VPGESKGDDLGFAGGYLSGGKDEWLVFDWPVTGVGMAEIVNLYAHKKDLIIVGQGEPGTNESDHPQDLPEHVVRAAGCGARGFPTCGRG
jgi:hypothetical protein